MVSTEKGTDKSSGIKIQVIHLGSGVGYVQFARVEAQYLKIKYSYRLITIHITTQEPNLAFSTEV